MLVTWIPDCGQMLSFHLWSEVHLYPIKCWMNVCNVLLYNQEKASLIYCNVIYFTAISSPGKHEITVNVFISMQTQGTSFVPN